MQSGIKMINTIRLRLKKPQPNTRIKEVVKAFHEIDKECYKFVIGCSQVYSNLLWFVSFQVNFDINELVGREIIIGEEKIVIEDANYPWKHATFKVHWLPLGTDERDVEKFVREDLNPSKNAVITENLEKVKTNVDIDEGITATVETGVIKIKIKYLKTTVIKNICGVRQFGDEKILITQAGKKFGCFRCQRKGHKANDCPSMKLKCKDCGQYGHQVCTYASRAKNDNINSDLPDHEEDDDDEEENEDFNNVPTTPGYKKMTFLGNSNRIKRQVRSTSSLVDGRDSKKVHSETEIGEEENEGSEQETETGEAKDNWDEDDESNMDEENQET